MSKDITEEILLEAGFTKNDDIYGYVTKVDGGKRTIVVTQVSDMYGRDYSCVVFNGNEVSIGYACVQTVEHFDKLMELMDIDFKLKKN
jgi:hypothetical protein